MKQFILLFLFSLGIVCHTQAQNQTKRIELSKEVDGEIEKYVFLVEDTESLMAEIDQSDFPSTVKQQIKDQLAENPIEGNQVFEFKAIEDGVEYSAQIGNQNAKTPKNGFSVDGYDVDFPRNYNVESLGDSTPKAFLGMRITPYLHQENNTTTNYRGVLVEEVVEGEAAYNAGLQKGDVITKINGIETPSPSLFQDALSQIKPRETVSFQYVRNGQQLEASSTAGIKESHSMMFFNPDENGVMNPFSFMAPFEDNGNNFEALINRPMLGLMIEDKEEQVVVKTVEEDSPAEKAGLETGDVIESINGKKIASSEEMIEEISSKKIGDQLTIKYLRDGKKKQTKATLAEGKTIFKQSKNGKTLKWKDEQSQLNLEELMNQFGPLLEQQLEQMKPQLEQIVPQLEQLPSLFLEKNEKEII